MLPLTYWPECPGKTPDKTSPRKLKNFNNSSSAVENANLSWGSTANEPRRAGKRSLDLKNYHVYIRQKMSLSFSRKGFLIVSNFSFDFAYVELYV